MIITFNTLSNMSVNAQNTNVGFDINSFLNLLQKTHSNPNRRRKSNDSDKLSIILSASEPESSMGDKQNEQASANKSSLASYSSDQADCLFREIKKTPIPSEIKLSIEKLQAIFFEMKKTISMQELRFNNLQAQYEEEKNGTDEVLRALIKMDESEKELWNNYNDILQKSKASQLKVAELEEENQALQKDLHKKWEDIEFMRKLVLVANENYESLERKCRELEQENRISLRQRKQRSSPEISSMTSRKKKSSISPSVSDRSNLSARKSELEENYRRLILRTLKSKAIR